MALYALIPCLLLGVFFVVAGWMKVIGTRHMVHEFQKFGYPQWLRVLTGLVEVSVAPLMLLPLWYPVEAAVGALLMCPVMVGAAYTNFVKRPAAFGWGTVVILLLCALPVVDQFQGLLALADSLLALLP